MAANAKSLEVVQIIGRTTVPDCFYMVHLKTAPVATLNTAPIVTILGLLPNSFPLCRFIDRGTGALPPHAHAIRGAFAAGLATMRAPSATANTDAAAASIRPKERALASL